MYASGPAYVTGRHGARRPQSVRSPSHGKVLNKSVHPRSKSEENVHKGVCFIYDFNLQSSSFFQRRIRFKKLLEGVHRLVCILSQYFRFLAGL